MNIFTIEELRALLHGINWALDQDNHIDELFYNNLYFKLIGIIEDYDAYMNIVNQNQLQCKGCGNPAGHGGLPCPGFYTRC